MNCPACGRSNPAASSFCSACGAALSARCRACGHENAAQSAFCNGCGDKLDQPSTASTGALAPRSAPAQLPASFAGGRYQVRASLGEGAKKRVYLARDTRLDRDVAFALIKADGLDADGLVRVRREAQAMGRLGDHPHVVTIYDTGDEDGVPFIVSQLMAGGSVEDLLGKAEGQRIAPERAMRIADQVCHALAHAHGRGVIHRDLKPGNVWLDADGNASLGDFGLAIAADRSRVTMQGMMVGTVAYMAPEQALGRQPLDRSDLYALGAMLYEMVAGRPPFLGDDAVGVISQHVNTPPVAPSWHEPLVPKPLEALIMRLLAKSPEDRPASAEDVARELRAILAHSSIEPATQAAEAATDLRRLDWGRFIGRRDEMDELKAAFESSLAGKPALAFISGEPGIGKTRLAEEFLVYAGLRGAQTLAGSSYEGEQTIPYRPFVEALRQYVRTRRDSELRSEMGAGAAEIANMVSEVRQRFPDVQEAPRLEAEAERLRLFDGVTTFLGNAARAQPLVLFLDDLHWADKPSLLLLQHIARHSAGCRLMVIATYRDVDLDRAHPLSEALETFRRAPTFSRVHLRGLPREHVDQLLAAIEPSEKVSAGRQALARALWQETEGNPFFIQEILSHLVEEGKLRREDGRWTAGELSITSLGIPEGVRQVVGRRLSHMSDDGQHMLSRLSAMTHGFTWDVLRATNPDIAEERLLDLLDETLAMRIIRERKDERPTMYDFTHALIRETLYDELSGPRRVLLHRQIGLALESLWADQSDQHVGELAYHFYQAAPGGDVDKAIAYCSRAGDRAAALRGWEDAASHYERGLSALDLRGQADDGARCNILLALGEAYMNASDDQRGRPVLQEAVRLAEAMDDSELLARAALAFGSDLVAHEMGIVDTVAVDALERALRALPAQDSYLRARILARLASELAFSHERRLHAEQLSREALSVAKRIASPRAIAVAVIAAEWVVAQSDWAGDLVELLDGVLDAAERDNDIELLYAAGRARLVTLVQIGEMEKAEEQLERQDRLGASLHKPMDVWATAVTRAMFALARGDIDLAEQLATTALVLGQQNRVANALLAFAAQILVIRTWQGRLRELEPAVAQVEAQLTGIKIGDLLLLWIDAEDKLEPATVSERFEHLMSQAGFASLPQDQLWLTRLALLTDICWYLDDRPRAAELYDMLLPFDGRVVSIESSLCIAPVAHYLGALAAVLRRWDDAERHFNAAADMNLRLGAGASIWTVRRYAQALMLRDAPGDRARVLTIVNEALPVAQERGMTRFVEDFISLKVRAQGIDASAINNSIDAVARAVERERPPLRVHPAPDGTVTVMFSDIEDSTVLTESLGDDAWQDLLRRHNGLIREQISAHDGFEVKTMGDGFMVAFQSARKGLECAIDIQRAFAAHNATLPTGTAGLEHVKVRIGLHAGEVIKEGGDFYGKNVIMASRVAGTAIGGEILVSALLRSLVESGVDSALFSDGREIELKGLAGTHTVFAVSWKS